MFEKPIDVLWHLLDPIQFLCLSASYLPITIFHLIATLQFSALFSPAAFKDAWFARFWIWAGPGNRENSIPRVRPLISQARGVVLEIGPGSGEWVDLYDQEKVTRIYGVEPNKDHHELLRKRIKDSGLSDIYVIVPVGIEELGEKWVAQEDVDTVITIQCLCSIPRPQEMIDAISKYLKEGGQWIIYEHVVTKQGGSLGLIKTALIDVFWPQFMGGCSITRDTEKWLRDAGSWSKVDLRQPEMEPSYQVIPHLEGILTK